MYLRYVLVINKYCTALVKGFQFKVLSRTIQRSHSSLRNYWQPPQRSPCCLRSEFGTLSENRTRISRLVEQVGIEPTSPELQSGAKANSATVLLIGPAERRSLSLSRLVGRFIW